MQIVSPGDKLHKISKPIFWEKNKKIGDNLHEMIKPIFWEK